MSANLKNRTMQTLLLGAALLTPLAAQVRNRNDQDNSRNANEGHYQNQGRPAGGQVPQSFENRSGGNQNRGEVRNNNFARDERSSFQNRAPVASAPRYEGNRNAYASRGFEHRDNDRGVDRRDYDRRFEHRDYDRRFENRGYDRDDHVRYVAPISRGYYVSRYPGRYWSVGEDRAFQVFLADRNMEYVGWDGCDPYLQDEYWAWRDLHSDRILFSLHFGIR